MLPTQMCEVQMGPNMFQRIRGEMLVPSERGMVQLGAEPKTARAHQIRDADVQKWRNDVSRFFLEYSARKSCLPT